MSSHDDTYIPFKKQWMFHTCPAIEVLYGGAAGPGKTRGLLEDGLHVCRSYPRTMAVFFRRTMPELMKVIRDSHRYIDPGEATYNSNDHTWTFANGSVFRFDSLPHEDSVYDHLSEEYNWIGFDEASLCTGGMMRLLRTRMRTTLRTADGVLYPTVFRAGSNPGNVGHLDLRTRYMTPSNAGDVEYVAGWDEEQYEQTGNGWFLYAPGTRGPWMPYLVWRPDEDDELRERNLKRAMDGVDAAVPNTRCYIPGLLEDNPILYNDPSYEATIWELAGNDPKLYKALRDGDWDTFEGQMFEQFSPDLHVIDPFVVPASWPKWRSVDWGRSAPSAIHWHAYDQELDVTVTYREIYLAKKTDREICQLVVGNSPAYERIDKSVADPAMWTVVDEEQNLTRAERWAEHGVPLQPANNDRMTGIARVHEVLTPRLLDEPVNYLGKTWERLPGWLVTRNCTNLIRTLPALPRDKKKPEDVDTKAEDHAYDSLRYGLMDRASTGTAAWGSSMHRAHALR